MISVLLCLVLLVGIPALSWADITSNRVLWLKMDEGTGTTLTDAGSGGHTCALDGTTPPTWATGATCSTGTCLVFDGTDDRAFCNDANDLSPTNGSQVDTAYSITGWFYIVDITDGEGILVARVESGVGEYHFWVTSSTLMFTLYDQSSGFGQIGRSAPLTTGSHQGQWLHLAVTYSGSETNAGINLYINGVDVDDTNVDSPPYTGTQNTTNPLEFGIYSGSSGGLNVRMKHVKIFTRALSPSDVVEDMNALTAVTIRRRPILLE